MIEKFIKAWDAKQGTLKDAIRDKGSSIFDYKELLSTTLSHCFPEQEYGDPDVSNIHVIDDGDYQGTLLFIIPEKTYQPSTYYAFNVGYGSCSGCDTMEGIRGYGSGEVTDNQIDLLWTLALHMMQRAKEI